MEKIKQIKNIESGENVGLIAGKIKLGQVLVYPTDTIYGLGCMATNSNAVGKIFSIKKRDGSKALILLMKDVSMLKEYCFLSDLQKDFIIEQTQKERPTTFILESKNNLPSEISNSSGSLAVRIPKDDFLQKLISEVAAPIVSTSVNISGEKAFESGLEGIEEYFQEKKPDLIVNIGKLPIRQPSMILDIRNLPEVKVLRD